MTLYNLKNIKNLAFSYRLTCFFASVIKTTKPKLFDKLKNNTISYQEASLSDSDLKMSNWKEELNTHTVRHLLKFYLVKEQEAEEICIYQQECLSPDTLTRVCKLLEEFHEN